jgi:hypothetical protein
VLGSASVRAVAKTPPRHIGGLGTPAAAAPSGGAVGTRRPAATDEATTPSSCFLLLLPRPRAPSGWH